VASIAVLWNHFAVGTNVLPVVNRADVHKLEGVVTLRDVLDAYGVRA
jgi:CBS domain-containing protein